MMFARPITRWKSICCTCLLVVASPLATVTPLQASKLAADSLDQQELSYLKGLSIEELLQTEVTSVSKKSELLFDTAAAVSVITQEDLQRAGVHTIAEALRMAPGIHVAQIDGSRWAISSRGLNDYFSNKLLVLIDGRSVYTPLFSGVYWNAQDTMIEDIDRIEVIRGPGATIWGANAVNGVINIITKDSANTQGGLLVTAAGNDEQPLAAGRYGGKIGDKGTYRLFAKGFNRPSLESVDEGDAHDSWQSLRTGFRTDLHPRSNDSLTIQGELYDGNADLTGMLSGFLEPPYSRVEQGTETYSGGYLLASWNHSFSSLSNTELKIYYDITDRDQVIAEERRDTFDLDFKHHWNPAGRHDLVWGAGYRWTGDDIDNTWYTSFHPASRDDNLWSTFLQDDIELFEDTTWLTLGAKIEHNDYSGIEFQPSIRLRTKPAENKTLWAAVSRAVRTPSRADQHIAVNLASFPDPSTGTLNLTRIVGQEDFDSEELLAYEAGYRWQPKQQLSLDLAVFYYDYDKLRALPPGKPFPEAAPPPPHLVIPLEISNGMDGDTYGLEAQLSWQATNRWKLFASYSWLELNLDFTDPLLSGQSVTEENSAPNHQLAFRSYLDLPYDLALDTELYLVDELDSINIDGYVRLDLRLGWKTTENLELSINGENLFASSHREFSNRSNIVASEIPTRFWVKAVYSF